MGPMSICRTSSQERQPAPDRFGSSRSTGDHNEVEAPRRRERANPPGGAGFPQGHRRFCRLCAPSTLAPSPNGQPRPAWDRQPFPKEGRSDLGRNAGSTARRMIGNRSTRCIATLAHGKIKGSELTTVSRILMRKAAGWLTPRSRADAAAAAGVTAPGRSRRSGRRPGKTGMSRGCRSANATRADAYAATAQLNEPHFPTSREPAMLTSALSNHVALTSVRRPGTGAHASVSSTNSGPGTG